MGRILLIVVLSMASFFAMSQPKKATIPQTDASAPLVFSSYWGPVGRGEALAAHIAAIAPAAILVRDNAGKLYTVNAFRINYKFKSTYRDDESGQTKTVSDLRVGDFNNTAQLSNAWAESIRDNVKVGDTILINKILFRNAMGKLQIAPELKIVVR